MRGLPLPPELVSEWHPHRNQTPEPSVSRGSGRRVWWLGECGHEWDTLVFNRVRQKSGCPYCNNKRLLPGFNDVLTRAPEVAKEWHPTKNKEAPEEVVWGSKKKVWWLCSECGREWQSPISDRKGGAGCLSCSRRESGRLRTKRHHFPHLENEWSPLNEKPITYYSHSCPNEHTHLTVLLDWGGYSSGPRTFPGCHSDTSSGWVVARSLKPASTR